MQLQSRPIPPAKIKGNLAQYLEDGTVKIRFNHLKCKYVLVGGEDWGYLKLYTWHIRKAKNNYYAVTNAKRDNKGGIHTMANVILQTPKGMVSDHIVHHKDWVDNRRSNLRIATYSENGQNRGSTKNKTSEYAGVTKQGWSANVRMDYKLVYSKHFPSEIGAALARDAAVRHHGHLGHLNFSDIDIPMGHSCLELEWTIEMIEEIRKTGNLPA